MDAYNVCAINGQYYVEAGSKKPVLIRRAGEPATFHEGWTPIATVAVTESVNILCVQHSGGGRSTWYLDRDFRFVTNSFSSLNETDRAGIQDAITRLGREIWEQLICARQPVPGSQPTKSLSLIRGSLGDAAIIGQDCYVPSGVFRLNDHTCADLLSNVIGRVPHPAAFISFLYQLTERDFLKDIVSAAGDGRLELPSPFDGQPLSTDIGLCINSNTTAYRFTDERHKLTYYVVGSLWRITMAAIYIPELGVTIYRSSLFQQYMEEFIGGPLDRVLFTHALAFAAEIETYLAAPRRTMMLVYLQEHLGHHLYNELGGLYAVVAATPRRKVPNILMLHADNSEMYGKIDQIFPVLKGKVDRNGRNPDQLRDFVYKNALCLLRPTNDYVPEPLAKRIIELNERDEILDPNKELFAQLSTAGFLIVMLGLRVENRTVVDQLGFLSEITDYLREIFDKVAVVVDGHNGIVEDGRTTTFRSHRESEATQSPMDVELDLVQALRDKYASDAGLAIISTIGAPMCASIYWCNRSAFFITPWGAGLAKYRWICNRPGLVVASHKFLSNNGENTVHLYDSPSFMEVPTPLSFITPDEVEDEPQAILLVDFDIGNRINFTVQPQAFRARIGNLLESLGLLSEQQEAKLRV